MKKRGSEKVEVTAWGLEGMHAGPENKNRKTPCALLWSDPPELSTGGEGGEGGGSVGLDFLFYPFFPSILILFLSILRSLPGTGSR